MILVDEAAPHELAVSRQQLDDLAGRFGNPPTSQGIAKNPGVSRPDAHGHVRGNAVRASALDDPGAGRAPETRTRPGRTG
jgi:hypothetical protein